MWHAPCRVATRRTPAPPPAAKALAQKVRQLRTKKGWSQERLAEEAGIHRVYLAGIELGQRNPSLRNLENLAHALGVSLPKLFE
ncbi:MAG: helix-turn-helix domain-containing protein [Rhodospirillaceae bacterium]